MYFTGTLLIGAFIALKAKCKVTMFTYIFMYIITYFTFYVYIRVAIVLFNNFSDIPN